MLRVQQWTEEDWRRNLAKRLDYAKQYRRDNFEEIWRQNESMFYNGRSYQRMGSLGAGEDNYTLDSLVDESGLENTDNFSISINYVFKYIRFTHSQMSANPPTCKFSPHSTDLDDRTRAENADRTARFFRHKHDIDDVSAQRNLKTLIKGTGYTIQEWDYTRGEIREFNKETGEMLLEGEEKTYSPSTWNIWLDPDATCVQDIRWFFELVPLPLDEALMMFPKHADKIRASAMDTDGMQDFMRWRPRRNKAQDIIEVYRYREKGLPVNGFEGRYGWCLADGTLLSEPCCNPNPEARLGLTILTDIDIEDQVYGASIIEFVSEIQEVLNALDSNTLYNLATHNVVRMIVGGQAQVEDEALADDPNRVVKVKGDVNAIKFAPTPQLMPDAWRFRDQLQAGSQETAGINEAMMGQISRETSSYTFQQQVNAGNMVRTRLFEKYTKAVKEQYRDLLDLAIQHWDEPKTVRVLGSEHAQETYLFDSTDLKGGWDILASYGTNLSLDPRQAREELLQYLPILEKIPGFNPRSIIDVFRLDIIDSVVDGLGMARRREQEALRRMIRRFHEFGASAFEAPDSDIPPKYREEMLETAREYRMSGAFAKHDDQLQELIKQRIRAHEDALAEVVAQAQPTTPQPPVTGPAGPQTNATPPPNPLAMLGG